jgi:proteasome lid subunit RPN8/RPN11
MTDTDIANQITTSTRLVIERPVIDSIRAAAERAYPDEFCGILLGRRVGQTVDVEQVAIVENVAETKRDRYRIDPKMHLVWQQQAEKHQLDVVGFVHSHPDHPPVPSDTDASLAWPGYVYVIASVTRGRLHKTLAWCWCDVAKQFEPVLIGT